MRFQFLHSLILNLQPVLLFTVVALATSSNINPPMAKPNCVDHCGDIPIPFPFGTSEACHYTPRFWVTCNDTFHNPPKLFWEDTPIEIKSISLLGQMTVMSLVSRDCVYANGTRLSKNPFLRVPVPFSINSTANKFTIVGCDSYGYVYGRNSNQKYYSTGCMASCTDINDVEEGSCTGTGCCQTSIPKNVWNVNLTVGSSFNYIKVREISNCTYGFLTEASKFKFHSNDLTNLRDVKKLPLVVDWAFEKGTCEEARKKSSTYGCKSTNSVCYKPENGYGYRCHCEDGYQGNPYLVDGCQDIDECNPRPGQTKYCEYACVNTIGGFHCPCPKGHHGDGKIGGEGCSPGESHTPTLVAG